MKSVFSSGGEINKYIWAEIIWRPNYGLKKEELGEVSPIGRRGRADRRNLARKELRKMRSLFSIDKWGFASSRPKTVLLLLWPAAVVGDGDDPGVERHEVSGLPDAVDRPLPRLARLQLGGHPVVYHLVASLKLSILISNLWYFSFSCLMFAVKTKYDTCIH